MRRYTYIDGVRGLSAITVLFTHFPTLKDTPLGTVEATGGLPLEWLLAPFYQFGALAVPMFWIISGFVFGKIYRDPAISGSEFAFLRFSRLYPLHFVTLVIVALLQWWSLRTTGTFQITPVNDAYHFILNLFFASKWGFETGLSFNYPIWSVSVEVLIYAAFFFFLKAGLSSVRNALVVSAAFFVLQYLTHSNPIALCGSLFFLGCAIGHARPASGKLAVAALVSALAATLLISQSPLARHTFLAMQFLLFPATVMLAGVADDIIGPAPQIIRLIGDHTYGIYLVHQPILVAMRLTVGPGVSGMRLLLFLLATAFFAMLAYRFVEVPAQRWLRATYLRRHPVPQSP